MNDTITKVTDWFIFRLVGSCGHCALHELKTTLNQLWWHEDSKLLFGWEHIHIAVYWIIAVVHPWFISGCVSLVSVTDLVTVSYQCLCSIWILFVLLNLSIMWWLWFRSSLIYYQSGLVFVWMTKVIVVMCALCGRRLLLEDISTLFLSFF